MSSVEEIFHKSGTVLEGHFLLASGRHSPIYWEKFRVLQFPGYTEQLCHMIATHYHEQRIQVVAGPTTGGIILAFETARQLGVRGIFAEREQKAQRKAIRKARKRVNRTNRIDDNIVYTLKTVFTQQLLATQ